MLVTATGYFPLSLSKMVLIHNQGLSANTVVTCDGVLHLQIMTAQPVKAVSLGDLGIFFKYKQEKSIKTKLAEIKHLFILHKR